MNILGKLCLLVQPCQARRHYTLDVLKILQLNFPILTSFTAELAETTLQEEERFLWSMSVLLMDWLSPHVPTQSLTAAPESFPGMALWRFLLRTSEASDNMCKWFFPVSPLLLQRAAYRTCWSECRVGRVNTNLKKTGKGKGQRFFVCVERLDEHWNIESTCYNNFFSVLSFNLRNIKQIKSFMQG